MDILNHYVSFLQEYKKLLERGIKDIFSKNISQNFIWTETLRRLESRELCESYLLNSLFTEKVESGITKIVKIRKPIKPEVNVPSNFEEKITFNIAKNTFENIDDENDFLAEFKESELGKIENQKLIAFKDSKAIYSKLYRAYNDIRNDSNTEIVLSVGLIQYSKLTNTGKVRKINQHLFHFPLKIDLSRKSEIEIFFSSSDRPYCDFFFLNNTPAEKKILDNIVDTFDSKVEMSGYDYIFDNHFKKLISEVLPQIADDSIFDNSIEKPTSDTYKPNTFKFSFSPSINIKRKKPRFFEKLTKQIKEYNNQGEKDLDLFNLLIRNPDASKKNSYLKSNYFIDELFQENKSQYKNLSKEDFSTFFPLAVNKEQKEIYNNYLKNRLTVVMGPPGTGKSHTIVNILCALLAEGKRVLVTAQTDKALESLLTKIPQTFDDLIFTKIQIENKEDRFSLEKSINNIRDILTQNFTLGTDAEIRKLNEFKGKYVTLKSDVVKVLEEEYKHISINDSFSDLRSYQILEKLLSKDNKEWDWLKDEITSDHLSEFSDLKKSIDDYMNLSTSKDSTLEIDEELIVAMTLVIEFDLESYLNSKESQKKIYDYYKIDLFQKDKFLNIDLEQVIEITGKFSNSDIVIHRLPVLNNLRTKYSKIQVQNQDISTNQSFSDLITNKGKYLIDIETYLAEIGKDNDSLSLSTRLNPFNTKFKRVKYLDEFTVNSSSCNNKTNLLQLKELISQLGVIDKKIKDLKGNGFSIAEDDTASLNIQVRRLNEATELIQNNYDILSNINNNQSLVVFANILEIKPTDVEAIHHKAKVFKEDFYKLKNLENDILSQEKDLNYALTKLKNSSIANRSSQSLNIENITSISELNTFKSELKNTLTLANREKNLADAINNLQRLLPKTFSKIEDVQSVFINKENFEFAQAYQTISKNIDIDLQKTKENLRLIRDKIFEVKCNILFGLAKNNFKKTFKADEIDAFINLLQRYQYNYKQSKRGIKDKVKFEVLAKKNSGQISKKLSCWVMNFNDVLDSIGPEPEIFDCIIVDEASQLDFNSLLLGYYGKSMIIVGDDKQTSPSSLSGADSNDFDTIKNKHLDYLGQDKIHIRSDNSLFTLAKMIAGTSNLALKEHFRCAPEIIEFSKANFYNNSLRPLKQRNSNRLKPLKAIYIANSFLENKVVRKEVETIKNHLITIIKSAEYHGKTIGVVSLGNAKHTEALKNLKEELADDFGKTLIDKFNLIIEDSPKFQGDERDVMIVSLGVALNLSKSEENKNPKPAAIIGNEEQKRRINVALSRAKEQMILFHSVKAEDLKPKDFRLKILSFFHEQFKPIAPFILPDNEDERNRYNFPKPFDSWFEYDVVAHLIKKGFPLIQPQYKVKEKELWFNPKLGKETYVYFKLDIVVHHNGQMIAIECDGDPFHSQLEDVIYDAERQDFLERVGWKIYRILYSKFKRNPSLEIQKMVDYIRKHTKIYHSSIDDNRAKSVVEEAPTVLSQPAKTVPVTKPTFKSSSKEVRTIIENGSLRTKIRESKIIFPPVEVNYDAGSTDGKGSKKSPLTNQNNSDTKKTNTNGSNRHLSYIDRLEQETISKNSTPNTQSQANVEPTSSTSSNTVFCYLNIFDNGSYMLERSANSSAAYKIGISKAYKNGYLLQFYDNGHVNKVHFHTLLKKKLDKLYLNGKNPDANLILLKLIKEDTIFSVKYKKGDDIIFKAHHTSSITNREHLRLQGYKVMYQDFDSIEYKILPTSIYKYISRLVFTSFTSRGKSVNNKNYEKEWRVIAQFLPNLYD